MARGISGIRNLAVLGIGGMVGISIVWEILWDEEADGGEGDWVMDGLTGTIMQFAAPVLAAAVLLKALGYI